MGTWNEGFKHIEDLDEMNQMLTKKRINCLRGKNGEGNLGQLNNKLYPIVKASGLREAEAFPNFLPTYKIVSPKDAAKIIKGGETWAHCFAGKDCVGNKAKEKKPQNNPAITDRILVADGDHTDFNTKSYERRNPNLADHAIVAAQLELSIY